MLAQARSPSQIPPPRNVALIKIEKYAHLSLAVPEDEGKGGKVHIMCIRARTSGSDPLFELHQCECTTWRRHHATPASP